jgi:hypothetical protein
VLLQNVDGIASPVVCLDRDDGATGFDLGLVKLGFLFGNA